MIDIWIPGRPQNWERARTVNGRHYTSDKSRAYRRHVHACAAAQGVRAFGAHERLGVDITVTYATRHARDIDNAAKMVLDALNGVAWADDSQVDDLRVRRVAGDVGVRVRVYALEVAK